MSLVVRMTRMSKAYAALLTKILMGRARSKKKACAPHRAGSPEPSVVILLHEKTIAFDIRELLEALFKGS